MFDFDEGSNGRALMAAIVSYNRAVGDSGSKLDNVMKSFKHDYQLDAILDVFSKVNFFVEDKYTTTKKKASHKYYSCNATLLHLARNRKSKDVAAVMMFNYYTLDGKLVYTEYSHPNLNNAETVYEVIRELCDCIRYDHRYCLASDFSLDGNAKFPE